MSTLKQAPSNYAHSQKKPGFKCFFPSIRHSFNVNTGVINNAEFHVGVGVACFFLGSGGSFLIYFILFTMRLHQNPLHQKMICYLRVKNSGGIPAPSSFAEEAHLYESLVILYTRLRDALRQLRSQQARFAA